MPAGCCAMLNAVLGDLMHTPCSVLYSPFSAVSTVSNCGIYLYSIAVCRNTALAMCGIVRPVFRLPYVPLSREQRERGAVLLRKWQQHIPGCKVRAWVAGGRPAALRCAPFVMLSCWVQPAQFCAPTAPDMPPSACASGAGGACDGGQGVHPGVLIQLLGV